MTRRTRKTKSVDYKIDLFKRLLDFDYSMTYLRHCMFEGEKAYRIGLRDVIEAHGGKV